MMAVDITKHRPGETIDVPLDDPLFNNTRASIRQWRHRTDWNLRIAYLEANHDPALVEPMYYCASHSRIEDGTHRFWMAEHAREEKARRASFPVTIHVECHHHHQTPFASLCAIVKGRKDTLWLEACQAKKWPHLTEHVDYYGRSVLDVGSQSGLTCLNAIFHGAAAATGVEIRQQLVDIAKMAAEELSVRRKASFMRDDWLVIGSVVDKFDIVHCMGLLHYFPVDVYLVALRNLANAAKKTLVLEMRLCESEGERLAIVTGGQTAPTRDSLRSLLYDYGFDVEHRISLNGGKRGLWIAERRAA